jgi:transcriptional regulator with XRE-family HTH domain
MSKISAEIGNKIRQFRQGRKMTLDELALAIHKSRSTLSKYERGDISVDIDTLYELANALGIRTEQLLYTPTSEKVPLQREVTPAFFQNLTRFYCYYFDGRNGKLIRSAFDVFSRTGVNQCKIAMYMNFKDLTHYQQAENTYWGYMEHFDSMTLIELTNQNNPMEKASIQILASFLDAETKWALWNGVSSRPLMPVAAKMLFSKKRLTEDASLLRDLKISKEDIQRMKYYNMFSVV